MIFYKIKKIKTYKLTKNASGMNIENRCLYLDVSRHFLCENNIPFFY